MAFARVTAALRRMLDRDGAEPRASLVAYALPGHESMPIVPALASRPWMDATAKRYAYRCLPLLIANQAGWFVTSDQEIVVSWNGGDGLDALAIRGPGDAAHCPAVSHFGHGIVTWHIPYLFRTGPGYSLEVRGPTNWPKDGACALDGIVETDWAVATFTMNWQITRPHVDVRFAPGEPVCLLSLRKRGELESVEPELRPLESDPETRGAYEAWARKRGDFLDGLRVPDSEAQRRGWEKDYFLGPVAVPGAAQHQTKLKLNPFRKS